MQLMIAVFDFPAHDPAPDTAPAVHRGPGSRWRTPGRYQP